MGRSPLTWIHCGPGPGFALAPVPARNQRASTTVPYDPLCGGGPRPGCALLAAASPWRSRISAQPPLGRRRLRPRRATMSAKPGLYIVPAFRAGYRQGVDVNGPAESKAGLPGRAGSRCPRKRCSQNPLDSLQEVLGPRGSVGSETKTRAAPRGGEACPPGAFGTMNSRGRLERIARLSRPPAVVRIDWQNALVSPNADLRPHPMRGSVPRRRVPEALDPASCTAEFRLF